jgi:small subunit ribosomal protein S6e
MNIVVSDPKTRKAYSINVDKPVFLGKKIGDTVALGVIGLDGYKAVITGGSDKDGFPMKPSLPGTARKKVLLGSGVGYRPEERGIRKRKRVRGNVIAEDIHQVNLKIVEYGKEPLDKLLKKEEQKEEAEGKAEAK